MAKTAARPTQPLRILVVDDEPMLLRLTRRFLQSEGCAVHTTSNPRQALALVQQNPHGWDLVMTDGSMPYMNGQELVDEIRDVRPEMACIIMSGYHTEDSFDGELVLLAKPFSRDNMRCAVRQATED
ncbi:MAG: two-component system cell cycle sensor histidine kinase/response regulator CckA [Kiritimatiellia bacterium]|jgi:two-component system cell cycle sensor histidine kinase/response regulator CckA